MMNNPSDRIPEMSAATDNSVFFPIVGVGASVGGVEIFTQLFTHLPLNTGMAFLLIAHLDPEHESDLTQILTRVSELPVHAIVNNQKVDFDHVYVIPRDTSLSIEQGILKLGPRQKIRTPQRISELETELAGTREYAESIFATVREPLLILDAQLRVKRANNAFYRMFHVGPAETIGKFIYDLGQRQWDIPRLRELLGEILSHHTTLEDFQVDHRFDIHGVRKMQLNAGRVLDPQRQSDHIILAIEDITDRVRQATATAHLAAIVASSDDAIISKDLNGIITSWNRAAETLFGYTAEEVIGQPITVLIPAGHLEEESQILDQIRRGEVINHYETVRKRKNGSLIDISLTVSPLRDTAGLIIGASKIAHDITERKRVEAALRESHIKLLLHAKELHRFNSAAVGRELRMIELKKEINTLSEQLGRPAPYLLEFEDDQKNANSSTP